MWLSVSPTCFCMLTVAVSVICMQIILLQIPYVWQNQCCIVLHFISVQICQKNILDFGCKTQKCQYLARWNSVWEIKANFADFHQILVTSSQDSFLHRNLKVIVLSSFWNGQTKTSWVCRMLWVQLRCSFFWPVCEAKSAQYF